MKKIAAINHEGTRVGLYDNAKDAGVKHEVSQRHVLNDLKASRSVCIACNTVYFEYYEEPTNDNIEAAGQSPETDTQSE